MLRTTGITAALACCLLLNGSRSDAGILNLHGDALPGWTGTVAFDNGQGLQGNLDYAVFLAADFNTNFAGLGYVPMDTYVYTYQLFNSGSDVVSTEIVGIVNPAHSIGTFDIGDVDSVSESFTPHATWLFDPEIAVGESSYGLAFSSPNGPMTGFSLTLDGGQPGALVAGIPTPAPEPTSLVLLGLAAAMLLLRRWGWNN